jgi:pimeloyl-ACP methyl ester carboxylesterase
MLQHLPSSAKIAFVFVHGTFGRGAAWTTSDSLLSKLLIAEFGPYAHSVQFDWTGNNQHSDRLDAAELLAKFLQGLLIEAPNVRFVLIAHSHGGNVVRYALASEELRERCCAFVALGTPFLEVSKRSIKDLAIVAGVQLFIWLTALGAIFPSSTVAVGIRDGLENLVTGILKKWLSPGNAEMTAVFLIVLFSLGCLLAPFFIFEAVLNWMDAYVGRRQTRSLTSLLPKSWQKFQTQTHDVPILQVLHVTTEEDEAYNYLTTLSWIAELPFRIWPAIFGGAIFVLPAVFAVCVVYSLFDNWLIFTPTGRWFSEAFVNPAIDALGLLLIFGVPTLFAISAVVPRFVRGTRFGFGGEGFWDNLLCRITINTLPTEARNAKLVFLKLDPVERSKLPPSFFLRVLALMRHCRIHSEPASRAIIVEWLREQMVRSAER